MNDCMKITNLHASLMQYLKDCYQRCFRSGKLD